jgi:GT2 family glycosyltransferase
MMDLLVAVINFNTREALRRCLRSFPTSCRSAPMDILVIDNGSTDGSAAVVREEFGGRVQLLANRENIGFARAVNQALTWSRSRYLLILNADIEVRGAAVEALYDFMEATPRAGVAGAKLIGEDGALQHSCRRFYTPTAIVMRRTPLGRLFPRHGALRHHLMLDWDHAESRKVDWIQGACLMIRREAIEEVGPMDERFFLYFEDVDLCRRMAAGGWGVYYVPSAELLHRYQRLSYRGGLTRAKAHHLISAVRYFIKWHFILSRATSPLSRSGSPLPPRGDR